jgi:hypothetical protein
MRMKGPLSALLLVKNEACRNSDRLRTWCCVEYENKE